MKWKWLTFAAIGAVFMLGGVMGTAVGIKLERERLLRLDREPAITLTEHALHRMSGELKLDEAQRRQVQSILTTVQPELLAAEQSRRETLRRVLESVQPQLLAILRADQVPAFEAMQKRLRERLSVPVEKAQRVAVAAFRQF